MDHKSLARKRLPELKQIRQTLALSQREMAERIIGRVVVKIRYQNVSKYERDKAVPPLEVVLAYGRIGKTQMDSIIDDDLEVTGVLDTRNG